MSMFLADVEQEELRRGSRQRRRRRLWRLGGWSQLRGRQLERVDDFNLIPWCSRQLTTHAQHRDEVQRDQPRVRETHPGQNNEQPPHPHARHHPP